MARVCNWCKTPKNSSGGCDQCDVPVKNTKPNKRKKK